MRDILKRVGLAFVLIGCMLGAMWLFQQTAAKQHDPSAVAQAQRPLKEGRIGKEVQAPKPEATTDLPDDAQRPAAAGDVAEAVDVLARMLAAIAGQSHQGHQHLIATFAAGVEENKRSLAEVKAELEALKAVLQPKPRPPAAAKRAPKPRSEPTTGAKPSIGPWPTVTTRTLHAVNSGVPPVHPQKSDL